MSSYSPQKHKPSLYPEVHLSNPEAATNLSTSSSSNLYPSNDIDVAANLFPEDEPVSQTAEDSREQILLKIPGAIVHLIQPDASVELASGQLSIVSLLQANNIVAVFARVGDDIQWPLARDEPVVKLDASHYFFALRVPANEEAKEIEDVLNYGLTIAAKGQEKLLKELDGILESYSCFSVKQVQGAEKWEILDARDVSPSDMEKEGQKEMVAESSKAYWTTLAPNVEDYSSRVARGIAAGSGQIVRGILWCGDVTVDRLKWGNEFLKKRMGPGKTSEVSPATLRRLKRVKNMTKMSEKVATGILSGVVKVSGFFTGSIANSKAGQKFFSLLPGEIVLASLDGFNKVCDAVEVAGRNVMSTSSVVTTGLVSQRYGEKAGQATNVGLNAAGHAFGTAWAVFKIRKALNPKSVIKPSTIAKAAARASLESKSKKKL